MAANYRWSEFGSPKDQVEQAVARGRDPYTLGFPREEVDYIVGLMNHAAKGAGTQTIDVDCPLWCPCGMPCFRNSEEEEIAYHRRHRCQPHKWWDVGDFGRSHRASPVRSLQSHPDITDDRLTGT
jgi:hypothetical protein